MVRALLMLSLTGCYSHMYAGITPGGSQDIELARELIESGMVPDQDHYTAEGLFSQHDLPISGVHCGETICPRAAATVHAPIGGTETQMMVQLGFGTNISLDTFARNDLDVVAVVDISGSMSGEMDVVKEALRAMVDQLGPADHMALVTFGSRARVRQARVEMGASGQEQMRDAIQDLDTAGSTDVESGMRKGYSQLDPSSQQDHRMMVFTDAQPNTGVTEQSDFVRMVREAAGDGIGTTVFGTGYHLGSELADAISRVEGGSYHFLSADTVERLFVEDFNLNVTPVAYDLQVELVPGSDAALGTVYGAPVDDDTVQMGASTLFLSRRSGGIAAVIETEATDEPMDLGTLSVRYRSADTGSTVKQHLPVSWEGGTYLEAADDLGVYKIAGLVDEFEALNAAARFCDGEVEQEEALSIIAQTADRLGEMAVLIGEDDSLTAEAELMRALHSNVEVGIAQCAAADRYNY